MKLCKDCKHYAPSPSRPEFYDGRCTRPHKWTYTSAVNGKEVRWTYDAGDERRVGPVAKFLDWLMFRESHCGREGEFWEPTTPSSKSVDKPYG